MAESIILLAIPVLGLFAILRGGRWNWYVVGVIPLVNRLPARWHTLLNLMVWLGWTVCIFSGIWTLAM
jgi:hypothetical protein